MCTYKGSQQTRHVTTERRFPTDNKLIFTTIVMPTSPLTQ